ncbi:hypothetical protein Trydic_g4459 [Trypoxylus dichotomus]
MDDDPRCYLIISHYGGKRRREERFTILEERGDGPGEPPETSRALLRRWDDCLDVNSLSIKENKSRISRMKYCLDNNKHSTE